MYRVVSAPLYLSFQKLQCQPCNRRETDPKGITHEQSHIEHQKSDSRSEHTQSGSEYEGGLMNDVIEVKGKVSPKGHFKGENIVVCILPY